MAAALPEVYDAAGVEAAIKKYVDTCIKGDMAVHETAIQSKLDEAAAFIIQCGEHASNAKATADLAGQLGEDAQKRITEQVVGLNDVKAFIENMMPDLRKMKNDVDWLYDQMLAVKPEMDG